MTLFIVLLICSVMNCLMLHAAERNRPLWFSLVTSVSALALAVYALNAQIAEGYVKGTNLPELASVLLGLIVAIDILYLVVTLVCLVKDLRFSELRFFFTYSPIFGFILCIASGILYFATSTTIIR